MNLFADLHYETEPKLFYIYQDKIITLDGEVLKDEALAGVNKDSLMHIECIIDIAKHESKSKITQKARNIVSLAKQYKAI